MARTKEQTRSQKGEGVLCRGRRAKASKENTNKQENAPISMCALQAIPTKNGAVEAWCGWRLQRGLRAKASRGREGPKSNPEENRAGCRQAVGADAERTDANEPVGMHTDLGEGEGAIRMGMEIAISKIPQTGTNAQNTVGAAIKGPHALPGSA
ncbi:hypothetical protein C8F04DRAFT_1191984 [Mycena alexandri]|uniref:Uncharacterized protein n=1 Tax=Mycena alexandri TaxID=1745969 RepID=A0AAD6WXL4_9AGAR|nr:hypothetical protein C8F04DRAFT_1191984 [Mycena alexandri]